MGGIGNVLFQIVAANRVNTRIYTIFTRRNIISPLLGWQIHYPIYRNFPNLKYVKSHWANRLWNLLIIIISRLLKTQVLGTIWSEKSREIHFFNSNHRIFAGYFQSKKFLSNSEDQIRDLAKELIFHMKPEKSGIILHFRWGDSIWARYYLSYYQKDIEELSISKQHFTLVTDDFKAWKWKNLTSDKELNYSYYSLGPIDPFRLMSGATKLYITTSTFSWWASHLLPENDSVVFPQQIYHNLGYYGFAKKGVI